MAKKAARPAKVHRHLAPLHSSFAATAIIGFFVSVFFVWQLSPSWGFTFMLFFLIMAIAAFFSMLKAPPEAQLR